MARLIMMLLQRFGLRGGMKKAADMGINPRQYMEIAKRGKIPRGELPRGATSPMPRRTTAVDESPPVSRRDWEEFYGKKYRGFGYGELAGAKNKPLWGPELDKAIDRVKGIKRQSGRYMARAGMGMRKQAFKKHRAAMKKARELTQKARKAQADARAHAEGMRLMDETYGAF